MNDHSLPPIPLSALVALYGYDMPGCAEVIALPVPFRRPSQAKLVGGACTIIAFPAPQWQRNGARNKS